jgi:hypothetical protein
MNEPRNWKWMVPAMLIPVLLIGSVMMLKASGGWDWLRILAIIPLFWMWVCGQAAMRNYRAYFMEHDAWVLGMRQRALAVTADTELAKTLSGLHPAYAKLLTMHTQTVWMLREGRTAEELGIVDYVLFGPRVPVRLAFVIHVLKHSNSVAVMPERLLSDGSKQFDPDGLLSDREQYRELVAYWHSQGRVTGSYGNQGPQWIYPWTPATIATAMDLELELGLKDLKNETTNEERINE